MELQQVSLKAGKTVKYEPEREEMEKVALKNAPAKEKEGAAWEKPDWAEGGAKLGGGNVEQG